MTFRAKLIAIEGIDGAGKRTQIELLSRALTARGVAHLRLGFPRYDSFFGRMVGRFLNGGLGPLEQVDPRFSALLFAGDRLEAKPLLEEALRGGRNVLVDRYVASNLAHQAARLPAGEREEFQAWLAQLEYEVYGLPREDLVIYLRLPARVAHDRVAKKAARDYTRLPRDLQEASVAHLEQAAGVYDRMARAASWATVECVVASTGALRGPEEIHGDVLAAVESRLFDRAATPSA